MSYVQLMEIIFFMAEYCAGGDNVGGKIAGKLR
jgi:hypothetical protein